MPKRRNGRREGKTQGQTDIADAASGPSAAPSPTLTGSHQHPGTKASPSNANIASKSEIPVATINNAAFLGAGEPQEQTATQKKGRRRRRNKGKAAVIDAEQDSSVLSEPVTSSHSAPTDIAICGKVNDTNSASTAENLNPTSSPSISHEQSHDPDGRMQYHHFVPRFVLREFACTEARARSQRDPLVNVYSMDFAQVTPTRVARCYGNYDMYRDSGASQEDQMHIEKALATLERESSRAITRIKKAQAAGERSVTITRAERNSIRKFLFIMKYRTQLFWGKYNRTVQEYNHVDRLEVLSFMRQKEFTKPIQVWLHNLKTILSTPIDVEDQWKDILLKTCFIHDAQWYIFNMTESFMALCEPANPEDEFIVTESAFGIHEGPTEGPMEAYQAPGPSGKPNLAEQLRIRADQGQYTEYHKMAPFSPRLLLVLRSNLLRVESKGLRKQLAKLPGLKQLNTPSIFEHLQLKPPVPSYGYVTIEELKLKDDDTFTFELHKLTHKDVRLFNSIILNEVKESLTWRSDKAMERTLEEYLKDESFKLPMKLTFVVEKAQSWVDVVRRNQLYRLLAILRGTQEKGLSIAVPSVGHHFKDMVEFERKLLVNPLAQGYFKLGGIPTYFMRDFLQGSLVSKMRNMIGDALPNGVRWLPYRNAVLRNQIQLYSTLPCTVIYWHVKTWRMVQERRQRGPMANFDICELGAEDAVANLANKLPKQCLANLMLHASLRKVGQTEDRIRHRPQNSEYSIFGYFGGLTSSFLLENTPFYNPRIGAEITDVNRDAPVPQHIFLSEMATRWKVKKSRLLEQRWGEDVAKFVWEWLYEGPGGDD